MLYAGFVHSVPGTPELRATAMTCHEAADVAGILS
eukprot:COSAG03_NODE_29117_length_190_cov_12.912088_1_plen_34_part_10